MAEPTEAVADAPRKAAKGLAGVFKGKPAWVWALGITTLLGVAYLTFARRNVEEPEGTYGEGDETMAVGDYGGYYPVATQGAYGGYDEPVDFAPSVIDSAGQPEPSPITVNVTYPEPITETGGGPAPRTTASHKPAKQAAKERLWGGHPLSWWQDPDKASKMVKVNGRRVRRWKWPAGGGYIHTRKFEGR